MIEMKGMKLAEICKDLIATKYNKYFSAAALVDEVVAQVYGIEVRVVFHGNKRDLNPFSKDKRAIRYRIINVLRMMEEQGEITKYSKYTWAKVKA